MMHASAESDHLERQTSLVECEAHLQRFTAFDTAIHSLADVYDTARSARWHARHLASATGDSNPISAEVLQKLARQFNDAANRLLVAARVSERTYAVRRKAIREARYTAGNFRAEWAASCGDERNTAALTTMVEEVFNAGRTRAEALRPRVHNKMEHCTSYVPTRTNLALQLIDRLALTAADVFYDLGCGLGKLPLLVTWLTGAMARGVEYQKTYCESATRTARCLGLTRVSFIHADVRKVECLDGTAFYMFDPFRGEVLDAVLAKLHRIADCRSIVVAAAGRTVSDLRRQTWLCEDGAGPLDPYEDWTPSVFRSIGI